MPYYDIVKEYYSSDKIILLQGEDWFMHGEHTKFDNHPVFIRELI